MSTSNYYAELAHEAEDDEYHLPSTEHDAHDALTDHDVEQNESEDAEIMQRWLALKRDLTPEMHRMCFGNLESYDPFNPDSGLADPGHCALMTALVEEELSDLTAQVTCLSDKLSTEAEATVAMLSTEAEAPVAAEETCLFCPAPPETAVAVGATTATITEAEDCCQAQQVTGVTTGLPASDVTNASSEHGHDAVNAAVADESAQCRPACEPAKHTPVEVESAEALSTPERAQCSGRSELQVDRLMVKPAVFASVQDRLLYKCTVDAFASDVTDALCDVYCTPGKSFLSYKLLPTDAVWIHAPLCLRELAIKHYLKQKALRPQLSACILLPAKRPADLLQLTSGMTQLAFFSRGADIFLDPNTGTAVRSKLDLAVWYDPPILPAQDDPIYLPNTDATVAAAAATRGTNPTPTRHCMQLLATVAGLSNIPVLLDPGAEGGPAYIDRGYCLRHGIKFASIEGAQVHGWGEKTVPIYGKVKLKLKMSKLSQSIMCIVTDNPEAFPLILGDDYLRMHKAVLNYVDRTCTLVHGKTTHVIELRTPVTPKVTQAPRVLSFCQAKRYMRPGTHYCLVLVRPVPEVERIEGDAPVSLHVLPDSTLQQIVQEYPMVFTDKAPHGGSKIRSDVEAIPLTDNTPVMKPMFRYSPLELEEMKKQVLALLEQGYIQPSSSPYGAPVLFVQKPRSTELRMVIDYRALNRLTQRNAFPLPRIDVLLDHLAGSKVFSLIDLRQAYHQIQLQDSDVPRTAFRTPFGHFEYLTLSFGLVNAPAVFQSVLNRIFAPYLYKFLLVYLDDCMIFSRSAEEHAQHLRMVLDVLKENNLTSAVHKCILNQPEMLFLGHIISGNGIRADPAKVKAIIMME